WPGWRLRLGWRLWPGSDRGGAGVLAAARPVRGRLAQPRAARVRQLHGARRPPAGPVHRPLRLAQPSSSDPVAPSMPAFLVMLAFAVNMPVASSWWSFAMDAPGSRSLRFLAINMPVSSG